MTDATAFFRQASDTLQRGLSVTLDADKHAFVHDAAQPLPARAHMLLSELKKKTPAIDNEELQGSAGGLGEFWTRSPNVAQDAADYQNEGRSPGQRSTHVVLHAQQPAAEHYWSEMASGPDHPGNYRVPLRPGSPVGVQGLSWGEPGGPQHHYDFTAPVDKHASLTDFFAQAADKTRYDSTTSEEGRHGESDRRPERGEGDPAPAGHPHEPQAHQPQSAARRRRQAASASDGEAQDAVERHPDLQGDLDSLGGGARHVQSTIDALHRGDSGVSTYPLSHPLEGWHAAITSGGHQVVHRHDPDTGRLHVGYAGHNVADAEKRLGGDSGGGEALPVEFHGGAEKDFDKLPGHIQDKALDTIDRLSRQERHHTDHGWNLKLSGWRSARADYLYRITHRYEDEHGNTVSPGHASAARLFIGHIGPHNYEEAERRLASTATDFFRQTASVDEDDYRLDHRPPGREDGIPLHDLTTNLPRDVYENLHQYNFTGDPHDESFHQAADAIRKARGNPDKKIHIYRSLPAEHAHQGFRPGDWVSTSQEYAREHGRQEDPKHDWPVIRTTVRADDLHTDADDFREWGYNGEKTRVGMPVFKGGYHQQITQLADGTLRPTKRRAPKQAAVEEPTFQQSLTAEAGDYRMMHQAPGPGEGNNNLAELGHEDSHVQIYRAVPHGIHDINPGDWISTSADYAHQHAAQDNDAENDWPVLTAHVPAEHVWTDHNDEHEQGYHGPPLEKADFHHPDLGEVSHHDAQASQEEHQEQGIHLLEPKPAPEIHTGAAVHLSPEDHAFVHDKTRPPAERAQRLHDAIPTEAHLFNDDHEDTDDAAMDADMDAMDHPKEPHPPTHVVLHGREGGGGIHHGISWAEGARSDDEYAPDYSDYEHHTFGQHTAIRRQGSTDSFTDCDQGHEHWGTAGAAGLLIRHKDEQGTTRYLLQKRSPWVQHGRTWSVPGGALHHGETPEEGSRREAEEEMGDLPDLRHHKTHTDDHGGWAFHTVIADAPHRFEPQDTGDGESDGHRWATADDIHRLGEAGELHPGFAASWNQVRTARQRTAKTWTWKGQAYGENGGYVDKEYQVEGPLYHGGGKRLKEGDTIRPGRKTNPWGDEGPKSSHVYFTTRKDTAGQYAEQSGGHVYEVEPTGDFRMDYNGDDYKTQHPLKVVRKLDPSEWQKGAPAQGSTADFFRQSSTRGVDSEGHEVELDPIDGWQHLDGSVSHDDGTTVSDGEVRTFQAVLQAEAAAESFDDGIMVALVPPREIAEEIAQEGGQPVEDLHVTMAYLGNCSDYTAEQLKWLPELVGSWAARQKPIEGVRIGGAGKFNNSFKDQHVLWAAVDIPGGAQMHSSLAAFLEGHGYKLPSEHGWTPHLTLAFVDQHFRFLPKLAEHSWRADAVVTYVGKQRTRAVLGPGPR